MNREKCIEMLQKPNIANEFLKTVGMVKEPKQEQMGIDLFTSQAYIN